jgi:hypothetical protein
MKQNKFILEKQTDAFGLITVSLAYTGKYGYTEKRNKLFMREADAAIFIQWHKKEHALFLYYDYVKFAETCQQSNTARLAWEKKDIINSLLFKSETFSWLEFQEFCNNILTLESDLYKILPYASNPCYQDARDKLQDALYFCKSELKEIQKIAA